MNATDVLDFWFGPTPLAPRREWFVKSDEFDDDIRQRFGALVETALAGGLAWGDDTGSQVAELIVLDQFTRNLFRDQARAFAGDARARTIAMGLIDSGAHLTLHPLQRWFVYMPLEHAEELALQDRSVALFEALFGALVQEGAAHADAVKGALDYAYKHRDVIQQFGRFPHRNAALGRTSTAAEVAYLAQPGSGF